MEPDPDPPPDGPLGYRNPADDRPSAARRNGSVLAGAASGVVATAFAGVVAATAGSMVPSAAVLFGLVAVAAIAGGIYAMRPANRRWFLAAFLLAVGVTAAVEGTCFAGLGGLH